MGHARALLGLADARMQAEVASLVARKALSVRETERLVRRMLKGSGPGSDSGKAAEQDPDIRRLQESLAETLGARVAIQHTARGKGKLVVSYNSLDELEGILAHIQ
jgi:ParB family chromosome partitioning protein